MQALSDEHVELCGSLRAEEVAKEVASRKLERVTSNLDNSITVRRHCTLCVCLSVFLPLPLPLALFPPSPVVVKAVSLVTVQGLLVNNMSGQAVLARYVQLV